MLDSPVRRRHCPCRVSHNSGWLKCFSQLRNLLDVHSESCLLHAQQRERLPQTWWKTAANEIHRCAPEVVSLNGQQRREPRP
jgi:hypothetical protein